MADCNLEEIRRVFDMVDENADGLVSVDEIIGFVNKLGMPISEDDLRCMLIGTPHEDCSCLRFEEFADLYNHSIFSTRGGDGDGDRDEEEDSYSQEDILLEAAFKVFDENKDGYISSTELQHVLATMGLIPQGHQCDKMICRFDSDSNGVFDFSEFKNMMSMSSKLSP